MGKILRAIAYSQKRKPAFDAAEVDLRGVLVTHRARASGKDHSLDGGVQRRNLVERVDFAINVQFAESAPDELRHLRTEIQNDDFFCHRRTGNLDSKINPFFPMRQEIVLRIIFGFYSRNIQDSYSCVFLAFLALYANERKYVIRVVGGCKIFAYFRRVHTVADQTLFRDTLDTLNTLIQIFSNWHSHAGFHDFFID